jgi:hypothetical protein
MGFLTQKLTAYFIEGIKMIGRCSECGKKRKLYHAIGSTVNALWCAECISKHREAIEWVYEISDKQNHKPT